MMSSTKPEVHSLSQCHQRKTKSPSQVTCIVNVVKLGPLGHVAFEICEWTDRQTDKKTDRQYTQYFALLPEEK